MPRFEPQPMRALVQRMRRRLPDRRDHRSVRPGRRRPARRRLRPLRRLPTCVEACPGDAATASYDWASARASDPTWCGPTPFCLSTGTAGSGNPLAGSGAASISATSMPVPATAANPSSRRSTTPSTTCTGSESFLRRLRASPICCWSRARLLMPCASRWRGPTRRCRCRVGSWRSAPALSRAASPAADMPVATAGRGAAGGSVLPGCPPNPAAVIAALLMFLDRAPQKVRGGRLVG